ncbi:unnamed protein product [Brassica oleracea]|uniref:(rape) hypothetical protein n=1 Tax=Brassica napus TaxID=3708 RepID=A0A816JPK5_BRANA|nr:unnamed protein product [Brassica napus]
MFPHTKKSKKCDPKCFVLKSLADKIRYQVDESYLEIEFFLQNSIPS